jgi:SAM-dependent methyltransferase
VASRARVSETRALRRAWDERAREDPLYWSCVRDRWRGSRDVEGCFERGREDAVLLLGPAFARLGFDPHGRRLLDLGAGFGRMFRGYCELGFRQIVGAEISAEMARLGMRWQAVAGARFVAVDGSDLACFRDAAFDACVSRGVLPYQRDEAQVWRLVAEIARVLAPGGVFLLHFGGRRPSRTSRALARLPRVLRRALRSPAARDAAETTLASPPERALERLFALGLRDLAVSPDPRRHSRRNPRYYVSGRKPAAT